MCAQISALNARNLPLVFACLFSKSRHISEKSPPAFGEFSPPAGAPGSCGLGDGTLGGRVEWSLKIHFANFGVDENGG